MSDSINKIKVGSLEQYIQLVKEFTIDWARASPNDKDLFKSMRFKNHEK